MYVSPPELVFTGMYPLPFPHYHKPGVYVSKVGSYVQVWQQHNKLFAWKCFKFFRSADALEMLNSDVLYFNINSPDINDSIGPSKCGRDRPRFGLDSISPEIGYLKYYRVLNIINLKIIMFYNVL